MAQRGPASPDDSLHGAQTPQAGGQDGGTAGTGLTYEQARDELVDVVRRLEAGGATLEESLSMWERGEQLAETCQQWLDGAKARLDAALGARET